jgi:hypothetical protein
MLTGVVGCTSSGSNGPSGTTSTSAPTSVSTAVTSPISAPTPSPSVATTGPNVRPGEKPPVLPDLATHNSRAGAAEFARFWFRALDWGYATTDSTLAKSLYLSACTDCARFMRNILDARARTGRHFKGGRIIVTEVAIAPNDHDARDAISVDVTANQAALKVLDGHGRVVESTAATSGARFRTWLTWQSDAWAIVDWKQAK